ncbi:hypothetical protein BHM03_00059185 [Ensete ventricosum]|nr:hypothetical protein BHM03_00059185 [Ensete ventricosum]
MLRSEATVGFGRALARNFCSNSLASWSKEKMEAELSWLYHIRAGPLKASNLKLVGIGLSCISGAKGEPCLELSPASSFDFVTSFCTSSNHLFTRRSCARSESIESDDNVSSSCWVGSTLRYGVVDFFEMIEGAFDRVSGGSCASRLGSRRRDCDLRDGHDSRSRCDWLLGRSVGEETGNTILRHGPFL